jgi:hypothetical protein
MSNLTDLLPAGAGGKQVDFVASGTIGSGVTVGLNSDGTVSAVGAYSQSVGTSVTFDSGTVFVPFYSAYDPNSNKVFISYSKRISSTNTRAVIVVGIISGTSITFGTPINYATSGSNSAGGVVYDTANDKVVVTYYTPTSAVGMQARVGTVSGTSISFGTPVVYQAGSGTQAGACYDPVNNKIIVANATTGNAFVGTVSGTSISFGSAGSFSSNIASFVELVYIGNSKVVVTFYGILGGTAVVGTVSGTSISFGTPATFQGAAARTWVPVSAYDPVNNKIVIAWKDDDSADRGRAIVGTISGTSISFGSYVTFNNADTDSIAIVYDSANGKMIIGYENNGNSGYGTVITGTVSGTTITFGSPLVIVSVNLYLASGVYDSNNKQVVFGYDTATDNAIIYRPAGSNNTSFIGISDAAISSAASGSVTIKGGISTNVTGLTPNQNYYVQTNGTLSTTASSVLAGKALSSTSINLDYTT